MHQKSLIFVLNKGFKFQPYVCNKCHDLLMMSVSLTDIAISNIKGSEHCCIISKTWNCEAKKLLQNIDLTEKSGTL